MVSRSFPIFQLSGERKKTIRFGRDNMDHPPMVTDFPTQSFTLSAVNPTNKTDPPDKALSHDKASIGLSRFEGCRSEWYGAFLYDVV
jgi:hypothetical protein